MLLHQEQFVDKYQRNNKQTGVKNLRCFPVCATEGHQSNGFCGRSVQFILEPGCRLLLAEFTLVANKPAFALGPVVHVDSIRERKNLMIGKPPLASGEPDYDWTVDHLRDIIPLSNEAFAFSHLGQSLVELRVRRGWHYNWVSNRHTCMNLHCLRAYMFEILSASEVRCVKVLDSPAFQVYSRRRSLKHAPRGGTRSTASAASTSSDQALSESAEESEDDELSAEEKQDDKATESSKGQSVGHGAYLSSASSSALLPSFASRTLRPFASSSSSSGFDMDPRTFSRLPVPSMPMSMTTSSMPPPPTFSAAAAPAIMEMKASPVMAATAVSQGSPPISVPYLSQLLEFVEISEHNLFRVDVVVSPLVFATAIQGLNPSLFDSTNAEFLFKLKSSLPTCPQQKKSLCFNLATHISASQMLRTMILGLNLHTKSHAEVIQGFLGVTQEAIVQVANAGRLPVEILLQPLRTHVLVSNAGPGIFKPLYPSNSSGTMN